MWLLPRSSSCALASACSAKALPPGSGTSEELPALWVTSSGTPMLRLFSWRGWQARRWSQRLYGPGTLRMSDGSAGLAQWIASWRDSLASRTPWPADAKEPTTPDGFGRQSPSAFAWFDPESSCWKTSPGCDLLGECLPYSQTWPRSGSVSNGTACERPTWARPISESGFSSWPTSRSTDGSKGGPNQRGSSDDLMLPGAVAQWMTPMVPNGGRSVSAKVVSSKGQTENGKRTVGLESQVRHIWAAPRANDSEKRGTVAERSAPELVSMAQNWPTPASRDQKGENSMAHMIRADGRTDGRTDGQEPCRPTAEFRDAPLFAPGPNDDRWAEIIAARPDLAPATQPPVRGLADGLAAGMDEYRACRLRCGGNGVVPLQAGLSFVVLARRAGIA